MNEPKHILEPYQGMNTRHICPGCNNRDKSLSRYIDIDTKEYLSPYVGRCNREDKCGYHFTPRQFFDANGKPGKYLPIRNPVQPAKPKNRQASYIPAETYSASLKAYARNHFVTFLTGLFGIDRTNGLISKYKIGTSKRWDGATIFWQIDSKGRIRTGKMMLYSPETGKRTKDPKTGESAIAWAHNYIEQKEFDLKQCFFGEHLLSKDDALPVAVVESEKTAIIASVYMPNFIWVASGSKTGLNAKCEALEGRKVVLYPDLGCFDEWNTKAVQFGFGISDVLEKRATPEQKANGLDLADFLIQITPPPHTFQYADGSTINLTTDGYPATWDHLTL